MGRVASEVGQGIVAPFKAAGRGLGLSGPKSRSRRETVDQVEELTPAPIRPPGPLRPLREPADDRERVAVQAARERRNRVSVVDLSLPPVGLGFGGGAGLRVG